MAVVLRKPDGGEVHLLGTCHSSEASAKEASELVHRVRPSTVVLELCKSRRQMLYEEPAGSSQMEPASTPGLRVPSKDHTMSDVASEMYGVLTDWTSLIAIQYSALDALDASKAGGEFRAAAKAADAVGAHIVLGDRDVNTTQTRLLRLPPMGEMLSFFFFDDPAWVERQAFDRHEAARALERTCGALAETLELPPGAAREARLAAVSTELARQSVHAVDLSFPPVFDGVFAHLISRFWNKQVIGRDEKAKLRVALEGLHRVDPLTTSSMTPTMRRVLLEERNLVLTDALLRAPGERVVGVVGKAHVPGIVKLWEEEAAGREAAIASRVHEVLQEPAASLLQRNAGLVQCAVGAGAVVGMWRSRAFRLAAGGVAGLSACAVAAIKDRLDFFQRTQREQAEKELQQLA